MMKTAFVIGLAAFAFVFAATALQSIELVEASHCPSGTYSTYCSGGYKYWCSNKDRDPSPVECGCTCSTATCQDGNPLTTNTCAGSYCSSSSCSSGTADKDNNPSNGCEVNLLTDPNNCGTVNNVCSSGLCVSGTCSDFSLSIDPTAGSANKGDSKSINATVTQITGSPTVTFSATGLPTGASASFSPTSCAPNCYSNATITTSASTPTGSHSVSVRATTGSLVKTSTYTLTVLQDAPIATCGNSVCESPETQTTCSSDCVTNTTIPSPVSPSDTVTIGVEFYDFRYAAGGKVKIDLSIDGTTAWNPTNGCFFGGQKLAATAGNGAIAWPVGTVSESGHFKIVTTCTLPSTISAGAHTLIATPTIY